jgi:hypothetical protein
MPSQAAETKKHEPAVLSTTGRSSQTSFSGVGRGISRMSVSSSPSSPFVRLVRGTLSPILDLFRSFIALDDQKIRGESKSSV